MRSIHSGTEYKEMGLRLLAVLSVALIAFALEAGLFRAIGDNPTLAFMLAGSAVVHLWTRPPVRQIAVTASLAVAFHVAYAAVAEVRADYFAGPAIQWGSFVGLASLAVLTFQWLRSRGPARMAARATLLTAAALPYVWILVGFLLGIGNRLSPRSLDPVLFALDGSLAIQPSFLLGRILERNPWLSNLTTTVYYALPFVMSFLIATERASSRNSVRLVPMLISMMLVGFCLFFIVPAAGPIYAFGANYPNAPPKIDRTTIAPMSLPGARLNAMPSLHMAGALIVWWNSRRWPRAARVGASLFLLATAFATLALGEHYAVDLVVAVPFTLVFQSGWTHSVPLRRRARTIMAGALLTAGWLAFLRMGDPGPLPPQLAWALFVGTCAVSLRLEKSLAQAAAMPVPADSPRCRQAPAIEVAAPIHCSGARSQ